MINNEAMVNSKLKEIAEAKGYKNAKRLADAMSEHFGARMSYRSIYALWDNTADLYARATLNRICQFLSVPLGLVIVYEADPMPNSEPTNTGTAKLKSDSRKSRGARAGAQG